MKDFFDVSQFFTPLLCMAEWYGEGTVPPTDSHCSKRW